jgi:hypothetical protein
MISANSNNDLEVLVAPAFAIRHETLVPASRAGPAHCDSRELFGAPVDELHRLPSRRLKFAKSSRIRETVTSEGYERLLFSITYEWVSHCNAKNKAMLKIERSLEDGVVFTMSGRIEVEDVAELQRLLSLEGVDRPIALDLRDVTLVDRDAVKFLASCEGDAIKLKNCPAYVRKWIDAEKRRRSSP